MIDSRVNEPEEGLDYAQRVGAYGIIRNDDNHLAVIKTSTGYFLPGGGIEEDEDYKTCLKRECIEETGHEIEVVSKIGIKSYFLYSATLNRYMESKGHFYECKMKGKLLEAIEDDHELLWVNIREVSDRLYLKNQARAVEQYINTRGL